MADIALFHSVLGVRPGVLDAADRLRAAGHEVTVVDQYAGRVFDDYDEAGAFAESIGYPQLMQRAAEAVADKPANLIVAGFSNGGGMSQFVATTRPVAGVLMLSGALALDLLGATEWPARVPAQIHYTVADPFRNDRAINRLYEQVREAGASIQMFNYPGKGHLFTDASLPDEYDADATELLWTRVLEFCATNGGGAQTPVPPA
jgi:dienelactone hydrolase